MKKKNNTQNQSVISSTPSNPNGSVGTSAVSVTSKIIQQEMKQQSTRFDKFVPVRSQRSSQRSNQNNNRKIKNGKNSLRNNEYQTCNTCLTPKDFGGEKLVQQAYLMDESISKTNTYYVDDPDSNTYLDQSYQESKNIESMSLDCDEKEVNNLLNDTNPIDMGANLLDITNNTIPTNLGARYQQPSPSNTDVKSRNTTVQQKGSTVSPVMLRDCKPKKNKFDNYKVFSDQRASRLRKERSQTSLGSRSSTAGLVRKNDQSSLFLDDGSLGSTEPKGVTFPKGNRGLLLKNAKQEQMEVKDIKKKLKKHKSKMKKRSNSKKQKSKSKGKKSSIEFKIPLPDNITIETQELSPENMKVRQDQIDSALGMRPNRTRPLSFDVSSSQYVEENAELRVAPTPPPLLTTVPDVDESQCYEDPQTAMFVPVARSKSPQLVALNKTHNERLLKAQERIQLQQLKLIEQENRILLQQRHFDNSKQVQQFNFNDKENAQALVSPSTTISGKGKESIGGGNSAHVSYPTAVQNSMQMHSKQNSSVTAQFKNTLGGPEEFYMMAADQNGQNTNNLLEQINEQVVSFGKEAPLNQLDSTFGKPKKQRKSISSSGMASTVSGIPSKKHSRKCSSGLSHWDNKDLVQIFKSAGQNKKKRLTLQKKSAQVMKKSKSALVHKKAPTTNVSKEFSSIAIMTQDTDKFEFGHTSLVRDGTIETIPAREHQNILLHQSPGKSKFMEVNEELDFGQEYQAFEQNEMNHDLLQLQQIHCADISSPDPGFNRPQFIEGISTDKPLEQFHSRNHSKKSASSVSPCRYNGNRPMTTTHALSNTISLGQHNRARSSTNMSIKSKTQQYFDPTKSSIMATHINHKHRVENLKNKFVGQKMQEKRILMKQVQLQKLAIMKVQKETKGIQLRIRREEDFIKEAKKQQRIKEKKIVPVRTEIGGICKVITDLDHENHDLNEFKLGIKLEIETELNLIQDIQFINLKYKKLITEQRKEKEKLAMAVNNQRKILKNHEKRKQMLTDDSAKLYDNFRRTLTKDQRSSLQMQKKNHHHKSREDLQMFD